MTYEPSPLEVNLTLALGLTLLSPYYRSFARRLDLRGNEHVLDFGSGSGICSRHIATRLRHAGHLACADISQGWMRIIRRTLRRYDNVSYHPGRITEIDLLDASFDIIVVHFVLHDIPPAERQSVVSALAQKLKPSGRLVIREPQGRGLALEEIEALMATAGLTPSFLRAHRAIAGPLYDGTFKPGKEFA